MSIPIEPYRISVPDEDLVDLRERLARTRWPDALEGAGWELGTDQAWLRAICDYWRDEYDWRVHEARINRYDQGMATIDGERLHFLHIRSEHDTATPMVMTHGWGGSIVEFLDVIDRLVDPTRFGADAADAFHLVIPSMPGYGFSGPTRQRGFHVERVGDAIAQLMSALGYERYVAQGGDWGALVTRRLAEAHAEHVIAAHFTMLFALPTPDDGDLASRITPEEAANMAASGARAATGTGYLSIQTTRPHSLCYGQTDSPAGLAGWLLEKLYEWVDHDGDLEFVLSRDQMLTNVMLYWLPNAVQSSARLYYESGAAGVHATDPWSGRVDVPTGYTIYPRELLITPRAWAEHRYNIVYWSEQERGGHFPAFEQPEAFASDLQAFRRTIAT